VNNLYFDNQTLIDIESQFNEKFKNYNVKEAMNFVKSNTNMTYRIISKDLANKTEPRTEPKSEPQKDFFT